MGQKTSDFVTNLFVLFYHCTLRQDPDLESDPGQVPPSIPSVDVVKLFRSHVIWPKVSWSIVI
jgi:hypothetical protein